MSFKSIYKRQRVKNVKFYLLKRDLTSEKNEWGYGEPEYNVLKEIKGIIQLGESLEVGDKGSEFEPEYTGYFLPTFALKIDEINNYRIKCEKPLESIIYKIKMMDSNLKNDHIQVQLIRDKNGK